MNICFESAKTGTVCLGNTFAALNGHEVSGLHIGVGILGVIAVAVAVFILRNPA